MRYEIGAILALLIIGLAACVRQSQKSSRSMAPSVAMMIGALILPVNGNLVIILSSNKALSTLGYFTYFLGMNVVMFALIRCLPSSIASCPHHEKMFTGCYMDS